METPNVRFSSAISTHPIASHAVGEVCGAILDKLSPGISLVFVSVTPPFAGAIEDISTSIRTLLEPQVLLIVCSSSVIGIGQEIEGAPAISLWCANISDVVGFTFQHDADRFGIQLNDFSVIPSSATLGFTPSVMLLLAEPRTFQVDRFFRELQKTYPGLPVIGGYVSFQGSNSIPSLWIGGTSLHSGAIGVFLGPSSNISTITSQGCIPIGNPYVVTHAKGNEILELGGKPPLQRLTELSPTDKELAAKSSIELGKVIDESLADFNIGDFLVRPIVSANQETGSISVGEIVPVGTTVQFHVRDKDAARKSLQSSLAGRNPTAALLFTCNGRGYDLFGIPSPDARIIEEQLGAIPLWGIAAAGEFGPVGNKNFLHSFTATLMLFQ